MVPEGWKIGKLRELSSKIGSGITPKGGRETYLDEGIPLIRSQNVGWGKLMLDDVAFIDERQHDSMSGSKVRHGDVLLNITGASIGRSAIYQGDDNAANVNQHVCIIRAKPTLSPEYLKAVLISDGGQKQIEQFQAGGNRQGLNFEQIGSFAILLPPLPEQQKIAEILGTWDKAIQTTEALLTNARTQKRALMQSLLTGTRRFPGFEDHPWREVRLGDVVAGIPGGGTPDKGNPSFWGGDLPWVSVKDLKSTVLTQTQDTITEAGLSSSATNAFPAGTIVMATRMAVGSCAILGARMAINQDLKAIIPNDLILNRYLFHCLQMSQDALATLGTGSTVKGITLDLLRELRIGLPGNKNEQAQISDAIDCAEHEVSALQSDLYHLRTEKKSLMQQLLTGKGRVVV